jgi:hypothetical protein
MTNRYRQEVFNVLLAQLLQERGVISAPENIIKLRHIKGRKMPDVIINFNGLRVCAASHLPWCASARESKAKDHPRLTPIRAHPSDPFPYYQ